MFDGNNIKYNNNKGKIAVLFPNRYLPSLQARIDCYLPEEDRNWGYSFCNIIMAREDYMEIKKQLIHFDITLVQQYHDLILKKLHQNVTASEFIQYLQEIKWIRDSAIAISHSAITAGPIDFKDDYSKIEEYETYYNKICALLETENSSLVGKTKKAFITKVKNQYENPEFSFVCETEQSKIFSYMKQKYNIEYQFFCRKKTLFQYRDFGYHTQDNAVKILKQKCKKIH